MIIGFYYYCRPVNSLIVVYLQVSKVVYLHNFKLIVLNYLKN